jgi:L-Ala-D/L-Glu epimerase
MSEIEILPYNLRFRAPWPSRKKPRPGFLLRVGAIYGDAAPLPDASTRTLGQIYESLASPSASASGPARHALMQVALTERAVEEQLPLAALLGRRHDRAHRTQVPVNALLPVLSTAATVRRASALVRSGYRTLKLKLGAGAQEIRRVAATRDAIGDRVRLRLDPNGSWSPRKAADFLARLESAEIEYVEQPIAPGQRDRLRTLAKRSRVPIAPDEEVQSLADLERLLRDTPFRFAIVKPMVLGGPDIAVAAIERIEEAGATPVVTDVLESGIGRAAALHVAAVVKDGKTAHGLSGGTWLQSDLVRGLAPKEGTLDVPAEAGLGCTVLKGAS